MTHAAVIALLGGTTILGLDITTDLAFAALVERGVPSAALDAFRAHVHAGGTMPSDAVDLLIASVGPLHTAAVSGSQLSPAASDCLVRMARLVIRAEEALGARESALRWFTTPNRALGGALPARLVSTDAGAVLVDQILGRVEHGVFS